ncbi:phosphoribosylanthranilate isomerase [Prolixibacteraceae bacterium JC049]|nr:phosphoribosylanthranilate isomerase [Prolixibacteraceae bacterium JC049]
MKIKVCGTKFQDNMRAMAKLNPDYLGFIFYKKSPRNVCAGELDISVLSESIKKVGVFVNETIDVITRKTDEFNLDVLQLHGDECPETCEYLKAAGLEIIKVFRVRENFDFSQLKTYEQHVNYFLFDTDTTAYGGSGKKFDWNILTRYNLKTPFFLSGGIGLSDAAKIKKLAHPALFGVDINSRFETVPGVKACNLVDDFFNRLRNEHELSAF